MAKDNKGEAPDMGDLSDVSAFFPTFSTVMIAWLNKFSMKIFFSNLIFSLIYSLTESLLEPALKTVD